MKGRVAFIVYLYPLGVSSMVVNSIKMFAEKGLNVDVYIDKTNLDSLPVEFHHQNINVKVYENTASRLESVVRFIHSKVSFVIFPLLIQYLKMSNSHNFKTPAGLSTSYYTEDYGFIKWLKPMMAQHYDYIFPVEVRSLIIASYFSHQIVYYNMELLDWSEQNPVYGEDKILLKHLEHTALRNIYGVAIQNDNRAEHFREINNYTGRIFILPVASMHDPVSSKGAYFRDTFAIPRDTHIVIYSGNIMPWAMCKEMVASVRDWPGDFCLVLHTWRTSAFESGYGLEVKELAEDLPVYLSQDYIDFEDMSECLSSADMALMFYEPIDTNFVEILFSSNKFAEYLKAGLPVICSDFPELKQFIAEHDIGRTIATMDELPLVLVDISADYDRYSSNVLTCYQQVLRFEPYFETLFVELFARKEMNP